MHFFFKAKVHSTTERATMHKKLGIALALTLCLLFANTNKAQAAGNQNTAFWCQWANFCSEQHWYSTGSTWGNNNASWCWYCCYWCDYYAQEGFGSGSQTSWDWSRDYCVYGIQYAWQEWSGQGFEENTWAYWCVYCCWQAWQSGF
jgi:hypothetical protein